MTVKRYISEGDGGEDLEDDGEGGVLGGAVTSAVCGGI